VANADRNGQRGLLHLESVATVPAGARSAEIVLTFHKLGPPTDNLQAYADSVVFQLDSLQITAVVNAASSEAGPVAPGEFVSLYGTSLGPDPGVIASGLEKGLAGVRVKFNGMEAYMTYAAAGQINAVVPYGVTGNADAVVEYNGRSSDPFPLTLTDAAPGIFTKSYGSGPMWAVNNDGAFNAPESPVACGGRVITTPKSCTLPVKVTIGGVEWSRCGPDRTGVTLAVK